MFVYVDYDDNVTLAVLVCAFADLTYSFSTQVDYLNVCITEINIVV